eukprot:6080803-Amphidinium_carterae.1
MLDGMLMHMLVSGHRVRVVPWEQVSQQHSRSVADSFMTPPLSARLVSASSTRDAHMGMKLVIGCRQQFATDPRGTSAGCCQHGRIDCNVQLEVSASLHSEGTNKVLFDHVDALAQCAWGFCSCCVTVAWLMHLGSPAHSDLHVVTHVLSNYCSKIKMFTKHAVF